MAATTKKDATLTQSARMRPVRVNRRWREENAEAIGAWNDWIDANGLPLGESDPSTNLLPVELSEESRRWAEQNAEVVRSSNEWVEKHGLPLEKYRVF